ncbi:hypothetical protein Tco_0390354 [Tanacetum coccineum]
MLQRQHKFDDDHHDMPLIYYMEDLTLYFGRPDFSLITGFRFGTDEKTFGKLSDEDAVYLCLLLAIEVIFMGRLLTFKVDDTLFRLVDNLEGWNSFPWGEHLWTHLYDEIKNLKERHIDEHYYGLKKDRNYIPTYTLSGFIFAFQIWILETFKRCERWWIKDQKVPRALGWSKKSIFKRSDYSYLFAKESGSTSDLRPTIAEDPPIRQQHTLFETYLSKLEKSRKHGNTSFMVLSVGSTNDNSVRKEWLSDLVIIELNLRVFELKTIIQVLAHEINNRQAKLQFNAEFSCITSELCDSLNSIFVDLIHPHDSDEDTAQDSIWEQDDDSEEDQEEDGDDGDTFDMWDITNRGRRTD